MIASVVQLSAMSAVALTKSPVLSFDTMRSSTDPQAFADAVGQYAQYAAAHISFAEIAQYKPGKVKLVDGKDPSEHVRMLVNIADGLMYQVAAELTTAAVKGPTVFRQTLQYYVQVAKILEQKYGQIELFANLLMGIVNISPLATNGKTLNLPFLTPYLSPEDLAFLQEREDLLNPNINDPQFLAASKRFFQDKAASTGYIPFFRKLAGNIEGLTTNYKDKVIDNRIQAMIWAHPEVQRFRQAYDQGTLQTFIPKTTDQLKQTGGVSDEMARCIAACLPIYRAYALAKQPPLETLKGALMDVTNFTATQQQDIKAIDPRLDAAAFNTARAAYEAFKSVNEKAAFQQIFDEHAELQTYLAAEREQRLGDYEVKNMQVLVRDKKAEYIAQGREEAYLADNYIYKLIEMLHAFLAPMKVDPDKIAAIDIAALKESPVIDSILSTQAHGKADKQYFTDRKTLMELAVAQPGLTAELPGRIKHVRTNPVVLPVAVAQISTNQRKDQAIVAQVSSCLRDNIDKTTRTIAQRFHDAVRQLPLALSALPYNVSETFDNLYKQTHRQVLTALVADHHEDIAIDLARRVTVFEQWIFVAEALLQQQCYDAFLAISSAYLSPMVTQIPHLKTRLNPAAAALLTQHESLADSTNDYAHLVKYAQRHGQPAILPLRILRLQADSPTVQGELSYRLVRQTSQQIAVIPQEEMMQLTEIPGKEKDIQTACQLQSGQVAARYQSKVSAKVKTAPMTYALVPEKMSVQSTHDMLVLLSMLSENHYLTYDAAESVFLIKTGKLGRKEQAEQLLAHQQLLALITQPISDNKDPSWVPDFRAFNTLINTAWHQNLVKGHHVAVKQTTFVERALRSQYGASYVRAGLAAGMPLTNAAAMTELVNDMQRLSEQAQRCAKDLAVDDVPVLAGQAATAAIKSATDLKRRLEDQANSLFRQRSMEVMRLPGLLSSQIHSLQAQRQALTVTTPSAAVFALSSRVETVHEMLEATSNLQELRYHQGYFNQLLKEKAQLQRLRQEMTPAMNVALNAELMRIKTIHEAQGAGAADQVQQDIKVLLGVTNQEIARLDKLSDTSSQTKTRQFLDSVDFSKPDNSQGEYEWCAEGCWT